jgi:transcriptional regulator with XRE-family HTH domain
LLVFRLAAKTLSRPLVKIVASFRRSENILVSYLMSTHFSGHPKALLYSPPAMPRKRRREPSFSERLISIRKARGITQAELAKTLGTTQRAISYYENESGFPPAPVLVGIAKILGVTTDELLGVKSPKVAHMKDDAETQRLWKRFRQMASLPDRDQRAVIRLINSLSTARGSEAHAS